MHMLRRIQFVNAKAYLLFFFGSVLVMKLVFLNFEPPANESKNSKIQTPELKAEGSLTIPVLATVKRRKDKKVRKSKPSSKKEIWTIFLPPSHGHQIKSFNTSSLSKEERDFFDSYSPTMIDRVERVGRFCEDHSEYFLNDKIDQLTWVLRDHQPDIAWCVMFKVASGTWTANFLRELHFNEDNPKIKKLPLQKQDSARFMTKFGATAYTINEVYNIPKTNKQKTEVFSRALRLIVVRHPLTRILSGFRNLVEIKNPKQGKTEEYYSKLRKKIIKKYRPKTSENKSSFPTFSEFVQYLIDQTKNRSSFYDWKNENNRFWNPYWVHCNVCGSDYSVVVKLETMEDDEKFMSIIGNLTEVKKRNFKEWRHVVNNITSSTVEDIYFKELTRKQLFDLYSIYKNDFDLFDYGIEDYIKKVSN